MPHPLARTILDDLRADEGRHVVLTGHAGDGKSTIALEIYKQLNGLDPDKALSRPMDPREDIGETAITIIKDLSERRKEEDSDLIQELLGQERRFLIVSNTGTLLDILRGHSRVFGFSELSLEDKVLTAISSENGDEELNLGGARFRVINLARMDNLELARKIFARMVAPERWSSCDGLSCHENCPIRRNVDLINHSREIVFERLFLAYRRMYEYGSRLTLRQITEHLAYLVTAGLEENDIAEMQRRGSFPADTASLFFNRFFGDDGCEDDGPALQMRAVSEIRKQGFGERPCPVWERNLWLRLREDSIRLGNVQCDEEFENLRQVGSCGRRDTKRGPTPDQAREQVRRMLFFLYDFSDEDSSYLEAFLNSPNILRWQKWQSPDSRLEMIERSALEERIYHVLQEHFTGVRLPEGAAEYDRRLYLTLSRSRNEVRQSAQVVLAQIDWSNETALELVPREDLTGGRRTDLEFQGRGRIEGATLTLKLPFLDYVVMRHFGEVGEVLQPAYVERLDRFKATLKTLAREQRNDIMLVRLRTDHTFRRQQYTVDDGRLEVRDV